MQSILLSLKNMIRDHQNVLKVHITARYHFNVLNDVFRQISANHWENSLQKHRFNRVPDILKKSCEPVTCAIIEASKWVCGMLLKNYQNFVDTSFDFLFGEKFWDKPRTGPSEANPIRHFIRSLTNLSNSSLMRIPAATYRNP